ncbi:MAG TPA: BTAD domain-containing putative transcriptional regulator [Methylobacter sp.]|jgi:predicted ATPase/DNA-binding SARP family transcriptional activator
MMLGGFDARMNGHPITGISYNKMRALLAYLAVEREQDHSREALAELLWSGFDPTTARDNLRRALSNLRKALETPSGTNIFSADKHTIRFLPNIYIDAIDFIRQTPTLPDDRDAAHHEERVIALYRGEFLAGLSIPDSPDFEDWLQIQRESLHRRALALLEKLSNSHARVGDYSKALQFALRHTELEPWNENAHCRVMHLYALNGQNSAAIQQYEICRLLLEKDLGVLPSEETQHLYEQIRNGKLPRRSTDIIPLEAAPLRTISSSPIEQRKADRRKASGSELFRVAASELRQVSVLYCDLITAAIDDPNEIMALLRPPQSRCVKIIQQFSGHIVQTHGGGLLAYFGYPQADEYAARRAVQAALAVTRETSRDIKIRASVHTGLIITGSETSMPDTTGITSKLAIQLRQSIEYGRVAISQDTHSIVAGYFDCISLGVQSFSEFARSLETFKVVQENGARTRLDAVAQLTPMAGRKAEIAELMALWREATQCARPIALIQGEAGIGKSRLLHALKERLVGTPHTVRELRCFPEFSQSPYHPLISMLETVMSFAHHDAPEIKFDKLVKYVETHYPASMQDTVSVFTQLLSLPIDGYYQIRDFSFRKQKEQTIGILLATLQALAAQQPLLFIVENLHWIDPSTLELLMLFVEQQRTGPVLAVFTARPEFTPPWTGIPMATLTLAPLAEDEVAKMIASLTDNISEATIRRIIERADGVPLFVEEIAKITTLDNQASIPPTLHDLLAARIDNMGEARYTAQLAATLGREFDLDLLYKVSHYGAADLERNLSALQDAGLIFKVNETTHQFKHALIQEAAYQSQTKADLKAAHRRIAQALLSDFHDIVATQPELLAQHLSSGGETQQSIEYWIKAGQRAARNSANLEAIKHFNSGLQLLMSLPSDPDRDCTEFQILVSLCPVLYATKGYGSEEATQTNTRISALSEQVGNSSELFLARWALLINTIASVGSYGVTEAAMHLLPMAHDDPLKKQAAHYIIADSAFWVGDFETTHAHTEQAITLYHPEQHQMLQEQFGENLSVSCSAYLSWALYFRGFPDQAKDVCEQMLSHAQELAHPHTLALALCFATMLHRWLNKPTETLSLSLETIAISQQHDFSVWLAAGEMAHGWALVLHGHSEIGIAELQSSITRMKASIGGISVIFLSALIESYIHLELYDKALSLLAEAQADEITTGDGHFTAELHRLKGVCLLGTSESNTKEAEACFSQAIAISRRQSAKFLELRAAISMARLWWHQDKREDARNMLEEIYNTFTEGFDSHDLQEAASLINL